ncbi:hypothetical protein Cgig2_020134 [Carnegiea gigantea]|uniref:Uncharacterized protein n=1 Tax=Carnegiea gigantea TaxID=171969 RepID=A0A9Q1QHH8_9CARY|nr:hypothetical protein Cgig2_020134 [Carnegiea gigantea]
MANPKKAARTVQKVFNSRDKLATDRVTVFCTGTNPNFYSSYLHHQGVVSSGGWQFIRGCQHDRLKVGVDKGTQTGIAFSSMMAYPQHYIEVGSTIILIFRLSTGNFMSLDEQLSSQTSSYSKVPALSERAMILIKWATVPKKRAIGQHPGTFERLTFGFCRV